MPYEGYARSMADLLMAEGGARADAARQKGAIWGQTMASLGQIPGQIMGMRREEQDRAAAAEDRAMRRDLAQAQMSNLTRDDARAADAASLEAAFKRADFVARRFAPLMQGGDDETYRAAVNDVAQIGVDVSIFPKTHSPGFVRSVVMGSMSIKDQLEAMKPQIAPAGSGIIQDGQLTGQVPFAPRPPEDLVGVGPENILTPKSQAAGQPGYRPPPPPEPLVGVGPENILTPRSQAAGQSGYRPPQQEPANRFMWAKDKTGATRLMSVDEIRAVGAGQPDTADMRNREAGKKQAAIAVKAVRDLGAGIFTKVGPAQRIQAIERGAEAIWGTDPEFRTYQDSRMALAGTLAVEQQGSRVSDADVKALWLPMVPDAYRDTKESYELKWKLIDAMRGVADGSGEFDFDPKTGQLIPHGGR